MHNDKIEYLHLDTVRTIERAKTLSAAQITPEDKTNVLPLKLALYFDLESQSHVLVLTDITGDSVAAPLESLVEALDILTRPVR